MKQKTICTDINYNNIVIILVLKLNLLLFIYLLIIMILEVTFSLLNFLFNMERIFIKKSRLQHRHRSCVAFSQ